MTSKASDADIVSTVKQLQELAKTRQAELADLKSQRDRFLGQQASKQADLAKLLAEIREAGLEPKDLRSHVETQAEELRLLIEAFDRDIKAAKQAFADLEAKQ